MIFLFVLMASACSEFEITCKNSCFFKYEQTYWVKDGKCFCGEEEDVKKYLLKIPRTYGAKEAKKLYYWEVGQ
jgi:hypothetical protein